MADQVLRVTGVWLPNKGAELMAHSVVAELGRRLPGARLVSSAQGSDTVRAEIGIPALPPPEPPRLMDRLLGRRARTRRETHVLDISGFAYGDEWGAAKARRRVLADVKSGRPTYLLPQAFGPFSDEGLVSAMAEAVRGARYIAARDRKSLAHLEGLGTGRNIPLMPDITFSLNVSDRTPERPDGPYGCLVLNARSIGAAGLDADGLIAMHVRLVQAMRAAGLTPLVVVHEAGMDGALSARLAAESGTDLVDLADARDIKALMAGAEIAVTGRFHGLVNALAGGVPAHALSWSHKYGELLSDFGRPGALFTGDVKAFCLRVEHELADSAARATERLRLKAIAAEKAASLAEMWEEVAADIRRGR
jgi:polysaccharide pyruvyl transferase WcaK-like protein